MPGIVYRALPKTTYDFSLLTAGTQSSAIWVAKGLDVSQYREGTALIRIHGYTFLSNNPAIKVEVFAEAPTQEDPATDFIYASAACTTGTVSLSGLVAPNLNVLSIGSTPMGAYLRIKLTGTTGIALSTPFNVTLSVDIVAKS